MNRGFRPWAGRLLVAALLVSASACEGPIGPEGPMGPAGTNGANGANGAQGPQGPAGPGTRLVYSGPLDGTGAGRVHLPAAAGTLNNPPSVSCYISDSDSSSVWLLMSTSNLTGACGIGWDQTHLDVVIVGSSAYWAFKVAVVY